MCWVAWCMLHAECCGFYAAHCTLCVACCIFTPSGPVGGNWHPVQVEPHCSAHGLEPHVWEQRPLRSTSAQLPKPVSDKNTCKAHMPSAAVGVPQGDLASACFLESLVPSVRLASQGLAGAGEVPEEQHGPCGSKCGQSRCRCGRVEPGPLRKCGEPETRLAYYSQRDLPLGLRSKADDHSAVVVFAHLRQVAVRKLGTDAINRKRPS